MSNTISIAISPLFALSISLLGRLSVSRADTGEVRILRADSPIGDLLSAIAQGRGDRAATIRAAIAALQAAARVGKSRATIKTRENWATTLAVLERAADWAVAHATFRRCWAIQSDLECYAIAHEEAGHASAADFEHGQHAVALVTAGAIEAEGIAYGAAA
jgi:hypothetical protein